MSTGCWAAPGGSGLEGTYSATGVRVVAAVVVLLLVAAVLVVLARVGLWQQEIVSDRVIRFFAWALAGVFLLETLAAFTWSKGVRVVAVRAGLARARTAGADRGGLGRSPAHPPATPDAALALTPSAGAAPVGQVDVIAR